MNTCKVISVVESTLAHRGTGRDDSSPIRALTQYWTPEGKMLAEIDPCAEVLTPERKSTLREILYNRFGQTAEVDAVMRDLESVM